MQMSRLMIGTSLLVWSLLFGLAPAAFAASGTHDTDDTERLKETLRLKNVTIPWHVPPPVGLAHPDNGGTCKAIPAAVGFINPVNNSSDRVRKITGEVLADGSQVIVQDDLIKGLASDIHDDIYHFVYKNRLVVEVSSDLPAIVSARMIDSFRLKKGDDIIMTVDFDWRWKYPAPTGITFDLGGDGRNSNFPIVPFVFATADGENPDTANGVTDWQQLSTQGDPVNCDPL
jgi:hypothetical protein